MRVRRCRLLLLLAVCSWSVSSSSEHLRATNQAQISSPSTDAHDGHATKLDLAVDGAKTPEAVPDEIAYLLFFRALAGASTRDPQVVDRALAKAGLESADRMALTTALGPFAVALNDVVRQRQARPKDPAVQGLERQVVSAARETMQGTLSRAGWSRLETYVRTRVKQRTVLYRGVMRESQR